MLKLLNIPYKYRKTILNQIQNQTTTPNQTQNSFFTNNDKYEELLCPAEEDDRVIDDEEQRRTFTQAILDFKMINNQKNETNERYFSEKKETPTMIEEEVQPTQEEESVIEKGEYIESTVSNHSSVQINPMSKGNREYFPLNKTKTLCYQCLHMILQEHCIQKYNKPFCSLHCVDVFEATNITQCKECNKKIEIGTSYPSMKLSSVYYCSVECLNKEEQIEEYHDEHNKSTVIPSPSSSDSEQVVDILDI